MAGYSGRAPAAVCSLVALTSPVIVLREREALRTESHEGDEVDEGESESEQVNTKGSGLAAVPKIKELRKIKIQITRVTFKFKIVRKLKCEDEYITWAYDNRCWK